MSLYCGSRGYGKGRCVVRGNVAGSVITWPGGWEIICDLEGVDFEGGHLERSWGAISKAVIRIFRVHLRHSEEGPSKAVKRVHFEPGVSKAIFRVQFQAIVRRVHVRPFKKGYILKTILRRVRVWLS